MVGLDDPNFYLLVQKHIDDRDILVLYILDRVDHYKEQIKFVDKQYKYYFVCTAGPYDHPKNLPCLDSLVQCQEANKDIVIKKKNTKIYDFLFMPGKNQIWRLELLNALRDSDLLTNSLWSICNPGGAVIDINTKEMPCKYELTEFDLEEVVYKNKEINRVIVPQQYSDSRCSIICETTISNDRVYLTEKTWKPLLAGHPFVAQANPGYYDYLKQLGFMTFSDLWTETHDTLHGLVNVCKTIKDMDLDKFLVGTVDAVTHNLTRARKTDWIRDYHLNQLHEKKVI